MKIKLTIIAFDSECPEFHFEKFIFHKTYYQKKFIFSQTEIFNPSKVCKRLEKWFPKFEFKSELSFDGYDSLDNAWHWECDDEEYDYDDYYEN
jgi:hypothetical protein